MEVAGTKDVHCLQTPNGLFEALIGQAAPYRSEASLTAQRAFTEARLRNQRQASTAFQAVNSHRRSQKRSFVNKHLQSRILFNIAA